MDLSMKKLHSVIDWSKLNLSNSSEEEKIKGIEAFLKPLTFKEPTWILVPKEKEIIVEDLQEAIDSDGSEIGYFKVLVQILDNRDIVIEIDQWYGYQDSPGFKMIVNGFDLKYVLYIYRGALIQFEKIYAQHMDR